MSIYDYKVKNNKNEEIDLSEYKDKVLLIVNTASKCGFTPQYEGLQELYKKYKDQGLEVLAFPCNQFGSQEPGSNEEIASFCDLQFNISFPLFDKIDVNGDGTHPLYQYLKEQAPGLLGSKKIKWNFTKFLVSKDGAKITRFAPTSKPESLESDIKNLLK
ncbi:glutathione peroxidase [Halobacteriovorax marinus SJ]|uniref:Glutathione peroxidase n=1 Tax=Halobacteriovorax marinus (strain ATCC BAA-682 / DSM 15412 / SJ) TaxID=862908 RepID=E1X5Q7_HALMS|nr:glutathione peroxidase [Halobacteriovorax marinus]CBW25624.1 glutathione peroxidase [Halobacteriovorax marinus SJ]